MPDAFPLRAQQKRLPDAVVFDRLPKLQAHVLPTAPPHIAGRQLRAARKAGSRSSRLMYCRQSLRISPEGSCGRLRKTQAGRRQSFLTGSRSFRLMYCRQPRRVSPEGSCGRRGKPVRPMYVWRGPIYPNNKYSPLRAESYASKRGCFFVECKFDESPTFCEITEGNGRKCLIFIIKI